ncbi:MFS transporter [Sphingomonas astaxanthinifaciens]|uniref:MFS transporter n=1 Tax=Sphingomonas astaxanthinifaciens DSM 22298 TaxID=1123267 RepID=A0ABQ5Z3S6_9SPHN|nr:MFS transporter [Sphingomonas astaxanthinifaciens]GLR46671.1 MFS transporter [Sphingomonas astaxanthinifaciens DSM 22298]
MASRNDTSSAPGADYEFKPHERPFMPGSPATPEHPLPRRIGYFLIGVLISISAGLANGILVANLPQIQGDLGLTPVEGGWIAAAYSMTNVCTSFVLIKFRQQFGLQRITRVFLIGFVLLTGLQIFVHGFWTEVSVRAAAGVIAAGFSPLGFFYIMQAMPPAARLGGMIMGIGLGQIALPLARFLSPLLLVNGDLQTLYLFEFGLALICFGCVALLRLPPSERAPVFEKLDAVTMTLFAPGIALLTAVLVQGRIVWWTTPWIGYALAASVVLIGAAMLIEHNRANPMLNTRWIASRAIIRFAAIAAVMRVLLSEQGYGSIGLLTLVGMGQDQLVHFYLIVTLASLAGLAVGLYTMTPTDLLRPIVVSIALIGIAAWMDADASNLTRPDNLLLSQAMIAFATILFTGPTMMAGVLRALSKGPSHMVSFSAVFGVSQTIGGLGGTALLGTFQFIRQKFHSHELVQSIVATDPLVVQRLQQLGGAYGRVVGDPVLRQAQGAATLSAQVSREAAILAFNDVFLLIAFLAALAFLWLGGRWLVLRVRGVNPLAADLAALQKMLANR